MDDEAFSFRARNGSLSFPAKIQVRIQQSKLTLVEKVQKCFFFFPAYMKCVMSAIDKCSHANDFDNAKSHAREKTLLAR